VAEIIRKNNDVRHIDLSSNQIGKPGCLAPILEAIKTCGRLETLSLR
jgi:hypothetical protein